MRYALSLLSIVLAVALFVSMRVTQASLLTAFRTQLDAQYGDAQLTITSPGRVGPEVLTAIENIPGARAAPIVWGSVVLTQQRRTIGVWGIDPLRDPRLRTYRPDAAVSLDLPTLLLQPDAVVVPRVLADRYGWKLRDRFDVTGTDGARRLTIAGLLDSTGVAAAFDGHLLFMPMSAAQRLLGRGERFDRIDVAIDRPATRDAVRAALPPGCELQDARRRDTTFEYLYSQFQTILVTVTIVASLIGAFIVYNAMSLSVVERGRMLGTFRALGAQPRELLAVFVVEAALIGAIASTLGAVAGRLMTAEALRQVGSTAGIILDLGRLHPVIPLDAWLAAPFVGMATAVLGAFIPARMAARLPPVEVIKSGALERRNGTRTRLGLMTSLPLLAACFVLVRHPRTTWEWTVAGLIAGLIALVLAGPHVVSLLGRPLLRWSSSRGATLFLAADSVVKFPARTSLTVVALGGSLSLVVALAGTIQSLERDIVAWMNDVFAFDLSLQVNELSASPYATGRMPGSFIDVVRRDPQCGEAYGVRATFLEYAGDDVLLIAYDVEPFQRGRVQRGKSRDPAGDLAAAAAMRAGKIAVSTNFAVIHGLDIGDRIELATPAGRRAFEIAHVQIDHSWFRGVLFMDLTLYRELWNDDTLTYIDIRLAPAADLEAYRAELTQRWNASHGVFVNRTQDLIDYGVRIMREWFRLANVQLLLAVIIGGVGVANTLLISVITQSRQIALLRAIGASAGHIRRMLATEAALVGLAGGVCGCVLGLITARWLILPMMIKASGIAPPFVVPVGAMAAAMAAALAISLGASVLPLRAVRRIDIVQGIGYE